MEAAADEAKTADIKSIIAGRCGPAQKKTEGGNLDLTSSSTSLPHYLKFQLIT
jgi:hypothetical protein